MGMRMRKALAVVTLIAAAGQPAIAQTHGGGPVEIPLRVEGGRLLVPVEADDGTRFEFALSTGTGVTVLSQSAATRLGGQTALTVGGVPVQTEGSQTLPDERLTTDGDLLDGMIGSNTLNQFDVLIDVPGGRLVLKPIGRAVEWAGMVMSEPVRLLVMHGVVLGLDVELDGRPYKAMLDVGTPTLIVNGAVQRHLRLENEATGTLSLGSAALPDLPVRVRDLDILKRWDPNGEGFVLVGAPVTYDCAISISWVHQEMRTCVR